MKYAFYTLGDGIFFYPLPRQINALSCFREICHTFWMQSCSGFILPAGHYVRRGVGLWGWSCISEWNAFLISHVNPPPPSNFFFIYLCIFWTPQICSGVDLPVSLARAGNVASGLLVSFNLCRSPPFHISAKRSKKKKERWKLLSRKAETRLRCKHAPSTQSGCS